MADDVRYGVFLLPDARTSAAVTVVTTCLRAQFGLVSAGRFPPHMTLAGSLAPAVEEAGLLDAVAAVAERRGPVPIWNAGPQRLGSGIAYDVHDGRDGEPNVALVDLAVDVMDVVRPLIGPTVGPPADIHAREDWRGHLSLASHDLIDRPELRAEVEEFVEQLAQPYPATFVATRMAVFRQHHGDWGPRWWAEFSWEHVRSFALNGCPSQHPRPGRRTFRGTGAARRPRLAPPPARRRGAGPR